MSDFQEWLLRRIIRSALGAMPYTARLFRVIREEALRYYPEDNVYGIDSYLQEAMSYSVPLPAGAKECAACVTPTVCNRDNRCIRAGVGGTDGR